jgi:hypothetical protein
MPVNTLVTILIKKIGHKVLAETLGILPQHLESIRIRTTSLRDKQIYALHVIAMQGIPGWNGDDTMAALGKDYANEPFKVRKKSSFAKNEAEIERMASILCGDVKIKEKTKKPRPPKPKKETTTPPKKKFQPYKRKKIRVEDSATFDPEDEVV